MSGRFHGTHSDQDMLALTLSRCSHNDAPTTHSRFLSMFHTTLLTHPSLYNQVDWRVMSSTSNGMTSLLSYQRGPYLALSNLLPTHPLHSLATNPPRTLLYVTLVAILSYQPCLRLFLSINYAMAPYPYTFNQHFQSLMSNSSEPNETEGPSLRSIACFNWKGLMDTTLFSSWRRPSIQSRELTADGTTKVSEVGISIPVKAMLGFRNYNSRFMLVGLQYIECARRWWILQLFAGVLDLKVQAQTFSRAPSQRPRLASGENIKALVSCLETETLNQKLVKRSKREETKNNDLVQWFRA